MKADYKWLFHKPLLKNAHKPFLHTLDAFYDSQNTMEKTYVFDF